MTRITSVLIVASIAFAVACSTHPSDGPAVGRATAAIAVVPPAVSCLRILAGAQTNDFSVTPGRGAVLELDGLPVGSVTFDAFAFAQPCNAIGSAQPSWGSPPVTASISAGQTTALTLKLSQQGSAELTIDFGDAGVTDMATPPDLAPTCRPQNAACSSDFDCCRAICLLGMCF